MMGKNLFIDVIQFANNEAMMKFKKLRTFKRFRNKLTLRVVK